MVQNYNLQVSTGIDGLDRILKGLFREIILSGRSGRRRIISYLLSRMFSLRWGGARI